MAPLLAFAGLILVAGASLWAMGFLDATIGDATASDPATAATADEDVSGEPSGADGDVDASEPVVERTAPPIVEPPSNERAEIQGSILFTRGGDIWSVSGTTLSRLTNSSSTRSDSSPVWSPDGRHIYFIRTTKRTTSNSRPGGKYTLYTPALMRMAADGSKSRKVYNGFIKNGAGLWFSHVVQPSVSPTGTVAVVSDGNDGSADEVTLHVINSNNGRMRRVATPSESRLGHNDPAYSPDGRRIAFTYNDNSGSTGQPRIAVLKCKSKSNCTQGKTRYLKPGYANPSWSPDGKLLAVEATDGTGRDIVIVNARRGDVRVELTTDGDSFAPAFSPAGDQIAYLHRDGLEIDLRVMTLEFDERGRITMVEDRPVTSDGGIDGASTPSWFIPPEELPADEVATGPGDGSEADEGTEASEMPAEQGSDTAEDAPPPPPGS